MPELSASPTPDASQSTPTSSSPPVPVASSSTGPKSVQDIADAVADEFNAVQGGAEGAKDGSPDADSPEESQEQEQKFKWKTRAGEEREATLTELKRNFGLVAESNRRMKEAASIRKGVESERASMAQERETFKLQQQESRTWAKLLDELQDPDRFVEFGKTYFKHDLEADVERKLIRRIKREMAETNPDQATKQQILRALDLEEENEVTKRQLSRYEKEKQRQQESQKQIDYRQEVESHTNAIASEIAAYQDKHGEINGNVFEYAMDRMERSLANGKRMSFDEAMAQATQFANSVAKGRSPRDLQDKSQSGEMLQKPDQPPMASEAERLRKAQEPFRPKANPAPKPTETGPVGFNDFFDQFDDRKRRRGS